MATKAPTAPKKATARKAEAPKTAPAPTPEPTPAPAPRQRRPEEIVLEEYGIDNYCDRVPRLLYCILCELVRGRSNG